VYVKIKIGGILNLLERNRRELMIKKICVTLTLLTFVSLLSACGTNQLPNETAIALTSTPVIGSIETAVVGTAPALANAIDDLITLVNQYVTSGDITDNAQNGLLAKLDTIKQKVTDGQLNEAVNELGAFINEVQAQQGKKISDAAVTALIERVQQVIAQIQAGGGVAVTQAATTSTPVIETATASTQPAATEGTSTTEAGLLPTPMGEPFPHQAEWDLLAQQIAQEGGLTTFNYDVYKLPDNTAWESTLAYYDTQAALAGWGSTHVQSAEVPGGHYAAWTMTSGAATRTFIVVQMDSPEGSFTLNIYD
jgi:hypothetical protein